MTDITWAAWALLGAFGQALGWAIKKQSLSRDRRDNNLLGVVLFFTAGICLAIVWFVLDGDAPHLSETFFWALTTAVVLNVVAVWCAFRALDLAAFGSLMAFLPLTSILIVPLELLTVGTIPNSIQILGIAIVVLGGIVYGFNRGFERATWQVIGFFGTTLVCYAVASTSMGVMQTESNDPFLSATLMHLGIGFGFLPLALLSRQRVVELARNRQESMLLLRWMLLSGVVVALLENGPIFLALSEGTASEVFSIKRLMPLFALAIGFYWFRERPLLKHYLGTVLMVIGAIMVIGFDS